MRHYFQICVLSICAILTLTITANAQDAYLDTALSLIESEQYEQALIPLWRAIQQDSTDVEALFQRGQVYEKLEAYDRALADYEVACDLSQDETICSKLNDLQTRLSEQNEKSWPTDRSICSLSIFATEYTKIEKALQKLTDGAYFPKVAAEESELGPIRNVDCYNLNDLDPELAAKIDPLLVGKVSDVLTSEKGFHLILKLFDGPSDKLEERPWEPLLAHMRDSLGVEPPPEIGVDSTAVAEGDSEGGELPSRRSRRESRRAEASTADSLQADATPTLPSRRERRRPTLEDERPDTSESVGEPDTTAAAADSAAALEPPESKRLKDIYNEPTTIFYENAPVLKTQIDPVHPTTYKEKGGDVTLHVLVDKNGNVLNAKVKESFDSRGLLGFNTAAIEAVMQWKYEPATRGGQPLMVWITETLTFKPLEDIE